MRNNPLNIPAAAPAVKLVVSFALMVVVLFAPMPVRADEDFLIVPVPVTSMTFKGDWDVGSTYAANDVVFYNGSSWFSLVGSNTGNVPDASSTQWTMLAQKGDAGPQGPAGPLNPNVITNEHNTAIGVFAFNSGSTGINNCAIGAGALHANTSGYWNTASGATALYSNTTGHWNTANGYNALAHNTTGSSNTAMGDEALDANTTGEENTAVGSYALANSTTGIRNTSIGRGALASNTTGDSNTAVGCDALYSTTTGYHNTALGYRAGYVSDSFTGHQNIYIGSNVFPALPNESHTIRIGADNIEKTYIAGISGQTSSGGVEVYINSSGKLGTLTSSIRYKEEVRDMGDASNDLMKLRPVMFYYKPEYADGPRILQYGLIAEEVAKVYPGLVEYDPKTGRPETSITAT